MTQIALAYDNTFVVLCQDVFEKSKHPYADRIYHFDAEGNILHRYIFEVEVQKFVMPSEEQLIVPLRVMKKIVAINLSNRSHQGFNYPFKIEKGNSF